MYLNYPGYEKCREKNNLCLNRKWEGIYDNNKNESLLDS